MIRRLTEGDSIKSTGGYSLSLSRRWTLKARPDSPLVPCCRSACYTFPSRPRTGCYLSDAGRRVAHARPLCSLAEWRRARQKP